MDGLGVLLFIIAAIVSVIAEGRKKKPPPPVPPRRRPEPTSLPPVRRTPGPQPQPRPAQVEPRGNASDMIPEDLWKILTGEAPPRREHPPEEMPPQDLPSWDEEAVAQVEEQSRERQTRPEGRSLEEYRRPEVVRRAPEVVSLEVVAPPEVRHAQFHKRLDARPQQVVPTIAEDVVNPLRKRLNDRATLRESFILQEVFGPPKGLE